MTHLITYITTESILMASDTRVSDISIPAISDNKLYWFADCGRKTFYLDEHKIGISFYGTGYFPRDDNSKELYPLPFLIDDIPKEINGSIEDKMIAILEYLKKGTAYSTTKDDFLAGFMAGYENNIPILFSFNTKFNSVPSKVCSGLYIEKEQQNSDMGLTNKNDAIELIKRRMREENSRYPCSVGGPIDILEIFPNNSPNWELGPHINEHDKTYYSTNEKLPEILCKDLNKYNLQSIIK